MNSETYGGKPTTSAQRIADQFQATDAQRDKVEIVMREFDAGTLKSSDGKIVQSKQQALAIAMSEAGLSK